MTPSVRGLHTAVFVDTSAFFALADRTDRFHPVAVEFMRHHEGLLVTSNLVIYETLTLIRMRLGFEPAVRFGRRLFDEAITPCLRVTTKDESNAWTLFRRYRDKRFSFVDCTSFVLMERCGIRTAFAFDDDFRQLHKWIVLPTTL